METRHKGSHFEEVSVYWPTATPRFAAITEALGRILLPACGILGFRHWGDQQESQVPNDQVLLDIR